MSDTDTSWTVPISAEQGTTKLLRHTVGAPQFDCEKCGAFFLYEGRGSGKRLEADEDAPLFCPECGRKVIDVEG